MAFKNPDSILGALYYNCVVVLVMATIFVGASISEAADGNDSAQDAFSLVVSAMPSTCLALLVMGMIKKGVTPGDHQPLIFGVLSLILSLAEGFMAALRLEGFLQYMYAAVAALQFNSTILSVMLWQATVKKEASVEA